MEHYKKGEYVITLFRIVILLLVIRHLVFSPLDYSTFWPSTFINKIT
jgi:hypothetical protein